MEDDFDYNEEYSFSDSNDDDDIRQEFELDEIRSDFSSNPEGALVRLRGVAENLRSIHCIEAAFDLLKLDVGSESFELLVNAVAFAPIEVDSFERITPLESSWAMLERHFFDTTVGGPMTLVMSRAVSVLKNSPQTRVYLKSLLYLSRTFLRVKADREALSILHRDLYPKLEELGKHYVWVPGLKYQVAVLEVEISVSSSPVDLARLNKCLHNVESAPKDLTLPYERCIMTEVHARLLVETKRLYEAKSLFEKAMRSYEETLAIHGTHYPLTRCSVFLVLVSSIIGKGSYDASLEVPLLKSLKDQDAVVAVSAISKYFVAPSSDSEEALEAMKTLEGFLADDDWKLASATILRLIRGSFIQLRTIRALTPYNRVSISSLVSRVGEIAATGPLVKEKSALTENKLISWIANGSLDRSFRLNTADGTIEEVRPMASWCIQNRTLDGDIIPLPKRYLDLKLSRDRRNRESAILDKWKSSGASSLSHRRALRFDPEEELAQELRRTLLKHRHSMSM